MRRIMLDTETTGLDYKLGDRVIEIACVEMLTINGLPSARQSVSSCPRSAPPLAIARIVWQCSAG